MPVRNLIAGSLNGLEGEKRFAVEDVTQLKNKIASCFKIRCGNR